MTGTGVRVLSLQEAAQRAAAYRDSRRVVVLANGAFDLLHVGHVRYLTAARALGDVLFVAVNSDSSVQRLKGAGRPIVPQQERIELLSALRCVDYLLLFHRDTVEEVLRALKPHIHAKGTDYTADSVPERHVVASWGGQTTICGDPKGHATTDVVAEILRRFGTYTTNPDRAADE